MVSDPPYALISITKRFGKSNSAPAQGGSDGRFARLSGGFMGQKWDGFESLEEFEEWVSRWAKLLIERALHPGAVCLFFGGTRTFHHLGVGLEHGGFEIVDTINWLHGQGFPKSHDISKGIDSKRHTRNKELAEFIREHREAAGLSRQEAAEKLFGTRTGAFWNWEEGLLQGVHGGPTPDLWPKIKQIIGAPDSKWDDILSANERAYVGQGHAGLTKGQTLVFSGDETFPLTQAVSDEAGPWNGYGTALKPAFEPIFLCRAPRGGKTFAQLAVEHGSGALNIDGARIAVDWEAERGEAWLNSGHEINAPQKSQVPQKISSEQTTRDRVSDKGRWPANLVLSHSDDCVKVGEFEVEGRTINRFKQDMMPFGNAEGEEYESEQMPPETVERWACVPECPVRVLDDQAGELASGQGAVLRRSAAENWSGGWMGDDDDAAIYGDAGGPSRFFYTAKASRGEKDLGLDKFYWKRTDDGFERITQQEWSKLPRKRRARGCIHPTVKPLDITRHLATLVLPPEQEGRIRRILIPFAGSGSEVIGAAQAGWDEVVGIEYEAQYVEIAKARLRGTLGLFASVPDG